MSNAKQTQSTSPMPQSSVEELMQQLDEQLAWFQGEEFCLEQAPARFQQAAALAERIRTILTELDNQVQVVLRATDEAANSPAER